MYTIQMADTVCDLVSKCRIAAICWSVL